MIISQLSFWIVVGKGPSSPVHVQWNIYLHVWSMETLHLDRAIGVVASLRCIALLFGKIVHLCAEGATDVTTCGLFCGFQEAAIWITGQAAWQRSGGRDHVLAVHHPWSMKSHRRFLKPAIWLLPDLDSSGNWYVSIPQLHRWVQFPMMQASRVL